MFLTRKNTQKSTKKVENVNFDTLRRPFWIPPFFGGGTLVFELFSTFSLKMGSRGIKWPIYPEFMMIWNYAQKITPYSPPLMLGRTEICVLLSVRGKIHARLQKGPLKLKDSWTACICVCPHIQSQVWMCFTQSKEFICVVLHLSMHGAGCDN